MPTGSGLMTKKGPAVPHLSTGEIADLRADIAAELSPMAALAIQEWTDVAAAAANDLEAATATVTTARTVTTFLAGGVAKLLAAPRTIVFTTAGGTAADVPATAVVTGTDINGRAQSESVALNQSAGTATTLKAYRTLTSIAYAAGDGTGGTVAIGTGVALGVSKTPKARAGLTAPVREIAIGAAVTTGTLSAANKTYTPSAAPNGTNDYAIYFEYDPTV